MKRGGLLEHIKVYCAGVFAALALSLLARSVRWRFGGDYQPESLSRVEPAIIMFWHGRLLMMPKLYFTCRGRRKRPPFMLISQHGDGRIIALATRLLGIRSVAGSSSRGGMRALLELVRVSRAGHDVGFTPDGPRGPRYEIKPGVVTAAQKTGLPIMPITYSTERSWQLRSWDGMIIPKPFSKGVYLVGSPIKVTPEEDPEQARLRIQSALHELTEKADRYWSAA